MKREGSCYSGWFYGCYKNGSGNNLKTKMCGKCRKLRLNQNLIGAAFVGEIGFLLRGGGFLSNDRKI